VKKKFATLLLTLLSATIFTSCASVTPSLEVPSRPSLPRISSDELECIAAETYMKLVLRDQLLQNYAVTLEEIIKSTR
jgi:hypothetical protein